MSKNSSLIACTLLGAMATLVISYCIPQEHTRAEGVDRDENFVMVSTPVDNNTDSIFVLNLKSGQLRGSVMNPRFGTFTNFYDYNVSADFNLGGVEPQFTMTSGAMQLPNRGRRQQGQGVLFVGEMVTGSVVAYTYSFANVNQKDTTAGSLVKLDQFQWRAE